MNNLVEDKLTIESFENADIDPESFDHEAHVYVAWLYLQKLDQSEAIARFGGALKRLTEKLGAPDKYHATLTWFFLLVIAERAQPGESWREFSERNHDLIQASTDLLSRYYRRETLFSDRARELFLLPDRLAQI